MTKLSKKCRFDQTSNGHISKMIQSMILLFGMFIWATFQHSDEISSKSERVTFGDHWLIWREMTLMNILKVIQVQIAKQWSMWTKLESSKVRSPNSNTIEQWLLRPILGPPILNPLTITIINEIEITRDPRIAMFNNWK